MNPRYTVVIVDNSVGPTGAFRCALNQAALLCEHARFVFVIPSGSTVSGELESLGLPFHELPFSEIRRSAWKLLLYVPLLVINSWGLLRILKAENATNLVMNDYYNLAGCGAKFLGFEGSMTTYVRLLPARFPPALASIWAALALRYSKSVVAVSQAVKAQLPINSKVEVVYDSVTLDSGSSRSLSSVTRFLYLSNYIEGKGHLLALKALRSIPRNDRNLRILFVGGDLGLAKNSQYKHCMQEFAESNDLGNCVEFRDFVSDTDSLFSEADVLLNFSEDESFSMTCLEASSRGLAVIATMCGGPQEILVDGSTGLLVKNRDIQQMADAMTWMMDHPEEARQMGIAGRARAQTVFSPELHREKLLALFGLS